MGIDIAFWVLAVVGVVGALSVVLLQNVFRAALTLMLTFIAVAGLYVLLSADFLAVVQVLIYIGGISVLIILAIMLTRDVQRGSPSNKMVVPALVVALLFGGLLIFVMNNTNWAISTAQPVAPTTTPLANKLLSAGGFILPVEVAATLLLAAVLGAIVLVRDK